jgi:acetolactate synthase I/II/III large subunit
MKVTEYVARTLSENGVDTIFGVIGGFNADLIDAIAEGQNRTFVLNCHEQGAAFAANAYAMVGENIGVATSSGAPSSCNLVAGIANAFFDSVPCLFLVGSVHTKAVRKSPEIRQNAFEELDLVSMVAGITKYAVKVNNAQNIRYCLEKALYVAKEGRKGPVVIDIPYDVARADVNADELRRFIPRQERQFDPIGVRKFLKILEDSKRPLLLLGGGARSATSKRALRAFLDSVAIPAVSSLCGLDALPHDHPCYVGFIGHYGNRYANFALANCDALIVLGSRLDERQIAGDKSRFAPDAKVVRVDIDPVEIGRNIQEHLSIYSSVENFLNSALAAEYQPHRYEKWHEVISEWKRRYPSHDITLDEVNAHNYLHTISDYLPRNAVICADVGQNQMFTAQSLRLGPDHKLLNSAGYGSMGYSLPAAIGAVYAQPDSTVISINGDGGLQMNLQELQVVKRDGLPIKIVVLNNNCLGMIRRLQERIFDDRTVASVSGYESADYVSIAAAYDLEYVSIEAPDQYHVTKDFFRRSSSALIEVKLPQRIMNNPEPGAAIDLQTPLLSQSENERIKKDCLF